MSTNSIPHRAASRVIRGIKDGVSGQVEDTKTRTAAGIVGMAEAVRRLGDELRGHSEPLANVVNAAGSRLEFVADQVRDADPAELAHHVAQFAKRRPALFVGAAFIVGLGVSQLLKAAESGEAAAALRKASDTLKDLSASSVGA